MNRLDRLRLFALLIATVLALPATSFADQPTTALGAIEVDTSAGLLDASAARMQRFYAVFRPDLLDPPYAGMALDDAPRCATDLVAELRRHTDTMTGAERHLFENTVDPIYRAWVADGGITWEQGDVDAARAAERSTCVIPSVALPSGGPYSEIHDTDNFSIHHNLGGKVTEARITSLGGWFEESLVIEHSEMGFYLPQNLLTNQMLVMIERLPSPSTGGFTSLSPCGTTGYMAYVVINDQWFGNTQALQSVAAHEFFHAIQIQYAFAELFGSDSPNRWWVEASAVFMETEVYPTLYDSQWSQASRWFSEPYRSLLIHDSSGFQYGTYLFATSIRQSLGESEWFHDFWDQVFDRVGWSFRDEMDELLAERDSSFLEEWGLFIERGATGDFEFNEYLSLEEGYMPLDLTGDHDDDDLPLDRAVDSSSNRDRPEYLGTNYVWFDSGGVADDQSLWITFEGNGTRGDDPVEWEVRLVAVDNLRPEDTWDLPLTANLDNDGNVSTWSGEVLLNDFGEDFDGAFLAASPTTDFGDGGVTWRYGAELDISWGDGGFIDIPDELRDDDDEPVGTGCAANVGRSTIGPAGLLFLLLVALGVSRRDG